MVAGIQRCPLCASPRLTPCFETHAVPVLCNRLWPDRDAALRAPTADIRLVHCAACDYLFNAAFDPAVLAYTADYDNAQHFSPAFRTYATQLAARLIEQHALENKTIIEIGCGDGFFLELLCARGGNRGVGFDPGRSFGRTAPSSSAVTLLAESYSEGAAADTPDLICCRHVLEHLPAPAAFLTMLRRSIGNAPTALFFEVPNAARMLRQGAVWDVIYEHCSYFTPAALRGAFVRAGFEVHRVREAFGGQVLCLDAAKGTARRPRAAEASGEAIAAFATRALEHDARARHWLHDLAVRGQRAVLWGAGSKGITLLNRLQVRTEIEYVVDISPRKQGRYIAGTGQQVVPPVFLRTYRPDVVILMNPLYEEEVRCELKRLQLKARIVPA